MSNELNGKTIAFLCSNEGTEQIELTEPWRAIEEAGGSPRLVSQESVLTYAGSAKCESCSIMHA